MVTNPEIIPFPLSSSTGELGDAVQIILDQTNLTGVVAGAANDQAAIERLDGTGVGAPIFTFSGSYTAQNSNISEWFGNRQQTRLRCIDNGGVSPVTFSLPGATALGTAFDALVTAGLPEVIRFIIEYTGPSTTFLQVQPRNTDPGTPQIQGTTSVIIRSGIMAVFEITRTSGTISSYVHQAIGGIGDTSGGTLDAIKLINPATAQWDAASNGTLPTSAVVKGNAYRVINAPSDGSGRFGEIMQDNDWVVWFGETFTSWSATPHQWFVLPAEDVYRLTALENDFLNTVEVSPVSDRNAVLRGANYADSANEIRLQLYATQAAYDPADLNTNGDIDEYSDTSAHTDEFLAIRLSGTQATLASVLPTLYVFREDSTGNFTNLGNLATDFAFQGDHGAESDYLANTAINYAVGDTLRIYVGTVEDRYRSPDLDITENNLTADVQRKLNAVGPNGGADISSLISKVDALYPLTPDVTDLVGWGDIYNTENATQSVDITNGYSLIADYRGDATRYESAGVTYDATGTNVIRYTGLGDNLYRSFGFKVASPADQVLMWIVDGSELIPYIDMVEDTGTGTFRVNHYTPSTTEDRHVDSELHPHTRTSGDEILTPGSGNISTFTLQNFPASATNTTRELNFNIDVFVNGRDSLAGDIDVVELPATNVAQDQVRNDYSVFLGPQTGRTVQVQIGYTLRVVGGDLVVDFTLVSAPSDVTVRIDSVYTELSYTAPATVARVDNFTTLTDELGNYTFTGETELLVTFHPFESLGFTNVVSAAISNGVTKELNDIDTPIPANDFASVEIPDQTALSDFEFRTFSPEHYLTHSDVAHLLTRRATQWCYGLAELRAVTEHAVTEVVDFTQGVVLVSPNNSRWLVTVANDGTLKTDPAP